MTTATDALARLDDGSPLPDDVRIAAVFDLHCQWGAQCCLICGTPSADADAKRREDR